MTFRTRLLLVFIAVVVGTVGLVAWTVSATTRRAFEELDAQRTAALVAQFQREYVHRGEEVVHRVQGMADAEATIRMALDLARPQPDLSLYMGDARGLANMQQLDFVELVAPDGTILSSAHWPARFGQRNEWVTQVADWKSQGAFLMREQIPDGVGAGVPGAALALLAVRTVDVGEKKLYVIGGFKLEKEFLSSLALPTGMRAMLYKNLDATFNPAALTDGNGPAANADGFAPFIEKVRQQKKEITETVNAAREPAAAVTLHGIPLTGRGGEILCVLLVGSSRRELVELDNFIRSMALLAGVIGVGLGVLVSWWAAARVTRPVQQLAQGAREVAAGKWDTRVEARGGGEIGELGRAFNRMTRQLSEQRERLLQAERVAAWRELARRLAHELKNPLHPLQITVENMERARTQRPEQFAEVYRESTQTLLTELGKLKAIVARFSDFAKMPVPQLEAVNVNDVVRGAMRLFDAQFNTVGRPPVTPEIYLDEHLPVIQADPSLLQRAVQNLVLNALDAMPSGGTLTVRTRGYDAGVRLEIADTGAGLTKEECERLFTPYYTTKQQGTGLGLAIVQSVVSDHGGKISVQSEPNAGTTFRIELPERPPEVASAESRKVISEFRPE